MILRSQRQRVPPLEEAQRWCLQGTDQDGFEVKFINDYIGRGTFTTKLFAKGDFLLEYRGELVTSVEGDRRQNSYTPQDGSFLFFFKFKGISKCVDATFSSGACRMVNDGMDEEVNCTMKVVASVTGKPHLCLFATRDLDVGEELRFDYGDENVPWRQKQSKTPVCFPVKSAEREGPIYNGASSRWKEHLKTLQESKVGIKQVGCVTFSKEKIIATGMNGSQIYLGMMDCKIPVAVKRLLKINAFFDANVSETLLNKKETLQHILPNLLHEEDEDFIYQVSPLCECNLEQVIERKQDPLREVLSQKKRVAMCMQLLLAVQELHSENIIHRDLKPSNVLLDGDGNLFLSDFGISRKMLLGTTLFTKAMGSLCWTGPGGMKGGSAKCKKSSDIQMAGCLMYYILSDGHIPHETEYPYIDNPEGVLLNFKNGTFCLDYMKKECNWIKGLLQSMIQKEEVERPTIEECLVLFKGSFHKPKVEEPLSTIPLAIAKPSSKVALAVSTLGETRKKDVKQLAKVTGSLFSEDITLTTTHLVMNADGTCERTVKFFQAVAEKLWVVSFDWVAASLRKGHLVEEEPFEISGDTALGSSHHGPRRARKGGQLLAGYSISIIGHSSHISKDELASLAQKSGAVVADTPDESKTNLVLITNLDNEGSSCEVEVFLEGVQSMVKQFKELQVVTAEWLLDSITLHEIQPMRDYAVEVTPKDKYDEEREDHIRDLNNEEEAMEIERDEGAECEITSQNLRNDSKKMEDQEVDGQAFNIEKKIGELLQDVEGEICKVTKEAGLRTQKGLVSGVVTLNQEAHSLEGEACTMEKEVGESLPDVNREKHPMQGDIMKHEGVVSDIALLQQRKQVAPFLQEEEWIHQTFEMDVGMGEVLFNMESDTNQVEGEMVLERDEKACDGFDVSGNGKDQTWKTGRESVDVWNSGECQVLATTPTEKQVTKQTEHQDEVEMVSMKTRKKRFCKAFVNPLEKQKLREASDQIAGETLADEATGYTTYQASKSDDEKALDDSSDEDYVPDEQCESVSTSETSTDDEDEEEGEIHVKRSTKKDGKRVFDKFHVCLFCESKQTHIARHLGLLHPNEKEVAAALAHPKRSRQRKHIFRLIVNKGDRLHNYSALEVGKGTLIARRQPCTYKDVDDYLFCDYCSGLFIRHDLWRHQKYCIFKQTASYQGEEISGQNNQVQCIARCFMPVPKSVSSRFWQVICEMKQDEVALAVKKEPIILKFGEHLFKKHGKVVSSHSSDVQYDASTGDYIRQKMREAGRLLIEGKTLGLTCIEDFVLPENFNKVVQAVKKVASFDEEHLHFKTPSLVLKCGHNLKTMSSILLCEASMAHNEEKVKQIQHFQRIYQTMWNSELSCNALSNLRETKWNKPVNLPCAKDIQILNLFLQEKMQTAQSALQMENTIKNWKSLAEVTLTYVIVFNRRRVGEVSKLLLETYQTRTKEKTQVNEDVAASLTSAEDKLASHFSRLEIRGKRGRKVPILLSPAMINAMDLLTASRKVLNITNPYFFANPKGKSRAYLRGSDCLRICAEECGAAFPTRLRSTLLRKHLGTTCQILNLTNTELEGLANFMGHNIRVHENFYRLPEGTLQAAKISKILLAMESGKMSCLKGKTLDEIDPNPNVTEISQDESDDEGEENIAKENNAEDASDSDEENHEGSNTDAGVLEGATDENHTKSSCLSKRKKMLRRPWSTEETAAIERHFMGHIRKNIAVKKVEAMNCLQKEPSLAERDWRAVKFKVKNLATKYRNKVSLR